MNIASMAGLATEHGSINNVGYTAAKHGVVALTRSFESSKPSVEASEGIKSYAICPYFADTGTFFISLYSYVSNKRAASLIEF